MTENTSERLAENLIYLRKSRKLTQQKLSDLSDVPRATIANIENGNSNPSLKTLIKISSALQNSIEELLRIRKVDALYIPASKLRKKLYKGGGLSVSKLLPENVKSFEFERIEIKSSYMKTGVSHLPGTKEIFHCVKGSFVITVSGEQFVLKEGDVLSFSGDQKHSYYNKESKSATTVAVGITLVLFT